MGEYTVFYNIHSEHPIQGHTVRIIPPKFGVTLHYVVVCQTCSWNTTANSMDEAHFDVRYHGLKMNSHPEINWNKLL